MQTGRKRAMIACLDDADARRFALMLNDAGFEVVGRVASARDALPMLRERRPDVVLAESILPGGDGASLTQTVMGSALDRYPGVVIKRVSGFRLPGEDSLPDLGAMVLDEPLTAQTITDAVDALEANATRLPLKRRARLQILLNRLGVPQHPGREMLTNAVALVWRDIDRLKNLRDRVYPDAARPLGKTGVQAERAIRHVIDIAWRTGEIDEQQRIFGNTIDARRGRPTCSEMIAQLADILRWEG